ncbi:MAG: polysaccharide biosynthesis protein [Immundisolibacteraceae bacterium]|nr:polysaccharide biosynthesis protein [Immundisolibacteraceae bacterium]
MTIREKLLGLSKRKKRLLQVAVDILLVWTALWLAFFIRLGPDQLINPLGQHLWMFLLAPAIAIPLFVRFGLYRAVLRYLGSDALKTVFNVVTLSALLLSLAVYWYRFGAGIPRSVVFNYWALSLVLIGGTRIALRQLLAENVGFSIFGSSDLGSRKRLKRVAIYGAGTTGNQLMAALRLGFEARPVAFIDDDDQIATRVISGLKVYKPKHIEQMLRETHAEEVLLAMPSVSRARRQKVLQQLEQYSVHVRSIPDIQELTAGRAGVGDLREIDVADLLGRNIVDPDQQLMARCITGKVVMVTGAGGSIGSELCRQILVNGPLTLVLFEQSELALHSLHVELLERLPGLTTTVEVIPILGSVRDPLRLGEVIGQWRVETLYHAAAYKHVPMVEHNLSEGMLNNVLGTLNTAQAAIKCGVANFVLISTDKAVRPTNVMGGTKRLAEMILQALSKQPAPLLLDDAGGLNQVNTTRFIMVRFGNVLGSSGSVIPRFQAQINKGGPVTVTHPQVTRYFTTIPEAAQLVIQAGAMGVGGELFLLEMGESVSIYELARKMIHLSGLTIRDDKHADGDIAIEFVGLRPGEKLYEELLIGDQVVKTEHPMIFGANEEFLEWETLKIALDQLISAARQDDCEQIRVLLRQLVSGYQPQGEIVDLLYQRRSQGDPLR